MDRPLYFLIDGVIRRIQFFVLFYWKILLFLLLKASAHYYFPVGRIKSHFSAVKICRVLVLMLFYFCASGIRAFRNANIQSNISLFIILFLSRLIDTLTFGNLGFSFSLIRHHIEKYALPFGQIWEMRLCHDERIFGAF